MSWFPAVRRVKLAPRETLLPNVPVPQPGEKTPPSPWAWIPTLYLAEGIPYALIYGSAGAATAIYSDLGVPVARLTFYVSLFGLPWVIKPLWSPLIEFIRTRRWWIWFTQLAVALGLLLLAPLLPAREVLLWTAPLFLVTAIISASHDIAADGFYILALGEGEQSFFSGVRNTCYRLAQICVQGPLLIFAGRLESRLGDNAHAWQLAIQVPAAAMAGLALYHLSVLPRPAADQPGRLTAGWLKDFGATFEDFLRKPDIIVMLLFLLLYRLGEAQLGRLIYPFLHAARIKGGLGLSTAQIGWAYGTWGVGALLVGGIAGGVLISRRGLRACLWPMVIIMHAPDVVFIYLSTAQPHSLTLISACLAVEQFGYGFGFAAYMLYMIYIARGRHQTAHYAICTGFMALSVMLPGMWSGWLESRLGFRMFFCWIVLSTIPGFIITAFIPLEKNFGRRAA